MNNILAQQSWKEALGSRLVSAIWVAWCWLGLAHRSFSL